MDVCSLFLHAEPQQITDFKKQIVDIQPLLGAFLTKLSIFSCKNQHFCDITSSCCDFHNTP